MPVEVSKLNTDVEILKLRSTEHDKNYEKVSASLGEVVTALKDMVAVQRDGEKRAALADERAEARALAHDLVVRDLRQALNKLLDEIRKIEESRLVPIERSLPLLKLSQLIVFAACGAILVLAWSGVIGK